MHSISDRTLPKHYGFPTTGGSACGGTDPASRRYAEASEELDHAERDKFHSFVGTQASTMTPPNAGQV